MAASSGPDIVDSGLVLALDAADRNSYDKFENLMTSSQLGNTILNDGGGVTLTTDTTVASPFGTSEGVLKCVHTTNTPGYFRRGQNMSLTAGVTYTFSFFFKNGTVVSPYGQNPINFGITVTTFSPTFQSIATSLNTNIDVGNGWYRQVFTFTPSYTQTYQVNFNQANNQTPLGTYYLYGFQLERGSSVTDYYATTGTAKTRGSTIIDLSNNSNAGTLTNGPTYSSANGGSIVFDGTNDYISTPITGTFPQISFDYWGFYDDPALNTRLRNESAFGDWTSNRVHWGTRWSVGMHWNVNGAWIETPATNLRYGWNHFSLIWNHTAGQRLIYINNILSTSWTTNGNMVLGDFRIGVATNLNAYYRGNISNFKAYNRALTAAEVSQNYNALKSRYI
jgi:hypothetical protein